MNKSAIRTRAILSASGYVRRREFSAKKYDRSEILPEVGFEIWCGPKGTIILQEWTSDCGCATYADWPLGHTFEELENAL